MTLTQVALSSTFRKMLGAAILAGPSLALAAGTAVQYELRALGDNQYEITYSVTNISLSSGVKVISLDFDPSAVDESTITIAPATSPDWTSQVLYSVPGLPAQLEATRADSGLAPGSPEAQLTVRFNWIGAGQPAAQSFTVWNPATFDVVDTGISTQRITVPAPAPAPSPAPEAKGGGGNTSPWWTLGLLFATLALGFPSFRAHGPIRGA